MGTERHRDERSRTPLPGPLEVGEGRTAVRLELLRQGRDLVLLVGGGETHVGAVAMAAEGTVRVIVRGAHREGPLAGDAAARLAAAAGCACTAVAGIHLDEATAAEIDAVVGNVAAGIDTLAAALKEDREA